MQFVKPRAHTPNEEHVIISVAMNEHMKSERPYYNFVHRTRNEISQFLLERSQVLSDNKVGYIWEPEYSIERVLLALKEMAPVELRDGANKVVFPDRTTRAYLKDAEDEIIEEFLTGDVSSFEGNDVGFLAFERALRSTNAIQLQHNEHCGGKWHNKTQMEYELAWMSEADLSMLYLWVKTLDTDFEHIANEIAARVLSNMGKKNCVVVANQSIKI